MKLDIIDNHRSRFVPVPSDWHQRKMRFAVKSYQTNKNDDENATVLSLTKKGLKVKTDLAFGKSTENYVGHQVVEQGQFVFTPRDFDATPILCGVADTAGCISNLYIVFDVAPQIDARFLEFYFWGLKYGFDFFEKLSFGMRYSFNRTQFENIPLLHPDLSTQREIADFLDRETARIDLLIEKKQKLVALLGEKWESAVENAISTGGKRTKLGHHIDILSGYAFPSSDFSTDPEDIPLLRGANVAPSAIRWDDTVYWSRERLNEASRFLLSAGDVVLGMDRPWIASGIRVAELTEQDVPALLLQRVCRIKPRMTLDQQFMKLLLTSRQFLSYFEPIMTGVSVPHISPDQVSSFRFEYVEREEQVRRATMAGRERERIIRIQKSSDKSIDRLKEYRSALITAAVTGQIDVTTYAKSGTNDRRLDAIQEEMGA